jgi:predicted RNA-binding Zn-ribbon protein involved in translation (DUF1610 family)
VVSDSSNWLLASTACPVCGVRNVVEVRRVLRAKPLGTFSLAGTQMKFSARDGWEYRCTNCGAQGPAEPKHPEQVGEDAVVSERTDESAEEPQ